ncbi:S41 family peptidase [Tsuneonella sp. YG55]|uniref:S41 family peptidase n=1 Tax=Tsuneonella litorea TaxID=2976475 RepID=A0A9X2W382_9SPHN|nr:S41 family peptidase [Tsuneonella litorea]MCT2558986.1 S41 family peptidase [Tsuneonella litorea]
MAFIGELLRPISGRDLMLLRRFIFRVLACASASCAVQTLAQETANPWRLLAESDARAALELVERNHPGAEPSLNDTVFMTRLEDARANVESRLPKVDSYPAYNALMSGLAAEFRDRHIWSNSLVEYPHRAWAGIILSRRGGSWVVGAQERGTNDSALLGYRLTSCDGIEAESWAKQRIGSFKGNPEIEAQLAANAAWLLVRDGNPFLSRPESCVFQSIAGERVEARLEWRQITVPEIFPFIERAEGKRPAAGMGVKPFEGGYWIHLQTLESSAAEVVDEVERLQKELRAAPMVVLDLRGNGGGDSSHASAIAKLLVGEGAANGQAQPVATCRGAFWRVSKGNLMAVQDWRDRLKGGDPQSFAYVSALVEDMEAALAEERAFAPALPDCASQQTADTDSESEKLPDPAMAGQIVLVTDRACFSSCLLATDIFRRLGALHVGEATDVSTRYMEVREELLPSGIRTFSTLQKVAIGSGEYGPYEPAIVYSGDLAQTDELKKWVAELPTRFIHPQT